MGPKEEPGMFERGASARPMVSLSKKGFHVALRLTPPGEHKLNHRALDK